MANQTTMPQLAAMVTHARTPEEENHYRHVIQGFNPQPSEGPGIIMPQVDAERQELILRIYDALEEVIDGFVMSQRFLAPLILMPMASLKSFEPDFDGAEIKDLLENEVSFSEMLIMTGLGPDFDSGKKLGRLDSVADKARERDGFCCNVTRTANAPMCHIFPFWCTSSIEYRDRTLLMLDSIATKMGGSFWRQLRVYIKDVRGTEIMPNLFALNQILHGWLDNGLLAFQPAGVEQRVVRGRKGLWQTVIKIHFLPECKVADAKSPLEVSRAIAQLGQTFAALQRNGLQPRVPAKGTGYIGGYLPKGELLKSGQLFCVSHATKQEAEKCHRFFAMQWECMRMLTVGGLS